MPTDRDELSKQYPHIPKCVEKDNTKELSEFLHEKIFSFNLRSKDDDTNHNFLMELAYLNGVDVETNRELGLSLIQGAAERGSIYACEKLVSMYKTVDGVYRNYETALTWQEKLCELFKHKYEENKSEYNYDTYLINIISLGFDLQNIVGEVITAQKVFEKALLLAKNRSKAYPKCVDTFRDIAISYEKLGYAALEQGDIEKAQEYYEKSLEISEKINKKSNTEEHNRNLSISYEKMGDIAREQGNIEKAVLLSWTS